MEIQLETMLNGCYWTAFVLAIALPTLLPTCVAAASIAGTLCTVIWGLRVLLRLYLAPSAFHAARLARRPLIAEVFRLYLLN